MQNVVQMYTDLYKIQVKKGLNPKM